MQHVQGLMENIEKLCSLIRLCHSTKHLLYLFPQAFYWNEHFCVHSAVSHLYKKAPSQCPCNSICTPPRHPLPLPELDLHRWEWDTHFNLCDILIPSPPLILCENAEVIFCLWWSAFWTPAVAVCLKRGPDPENSYSCAYIGCVSCPTSETVIQKCNFSPDLPWQGLERWGPGLTCCRGLTT